MRRRTPVSPGNKQKYDHLPPDEAVHQAWIQPGRFLDWHEKMRLRVRDAMPLLARALDRFAIERHWQTYVYYRGLDADGDQEGGARREHPIVVVRELFARGWREARLVDDDDRALAGICPQTTRHPRHWWVSEEVQ